MGPQLVEKIAIDVPVEWAKQNPALGFERADDGHWENSRTDRRREIFSKPCSRPDDRSLSAAKFPISRLIVSHMLAWVL